MAVANTKTLDTRAFPHGHDSANESTAHTVEEAMMIGRRAQARALGAGFIGGAHWLADVAAKWRQGRKEAKAIAELNALDDRTLRDIGVSHRSQIISAVRALSERGVLATGVSATPTLAVHGGGSAAAEVRVATSDTTDRAA